MQMISSFLEFMKTVAIIVLVAFFVRYFLIQPYIVEGSSMEPNFHNSEYLLVDKISYRYHNIVRGDVIVFHPPSQPKLNYIKRVIALPGDRIEIKNGEILVNGAQLREEYIRDGQTLVRNSSAANLSQKLRPNEYFVLGDNREHSSDSREIGSIPRENIIGRAWLVVFPISDFGLVFSPHYVTAPKLNQLAHLKTSFP